MLTKMYVKASGWYHSDEGSTGVEYALLVFLIGIAIAGGAAVLGPQISTVLSNAATRLGAAVAGG